MNNSLLLKETIELFELRKTIKFTNELMMKGSVNFNREHILVINLNDDSDITNMEKILLQIKPAYVNLIINDPLGDYKLIQETCDKVLTCFLKININYLYLNFILPKICCHLINALENFFKFYDSDLSIHFQITLKIDESIKLNRALKAIRKPFSFSLELAPTAIRLASGFLLDKNSILDYKNLISLELIYPDFINYNINNIWDVIYKATKANHLQRLSINTLENIDADKIRQLAKNLKNNKSLLVFKYHAPKIARKVLFEFLSLLCSNKNIVQFNIESSKRPRKKLSISDFIPETNTRILKLLFKTTANEDYIDKNSKYKIQNITNRNKSIFYSLCSTLFHLNESNTNVNSYDTSYAFLNKDTDDTIPLSHTILSNLMKQLKVELLNKDILNFKYILALNANINKLKNLIIDKYLYQNCISKTLHLIKCPKEFGIL